MAIRRCAALLLLAACGRERSAPPNVVSSVVSPDDAGSGVRHEVDASRRSLLELVRVDDSIDPLVAHATDGDLASHRITILAEHVSVGPDLKAETHFAMASSAGASTGDTVERLKRWLGRIQLPPDARFAFEEVFEVDPDTMIENSEGVRSLLLVGESVIRPGDVRRARVPVVKNSTGSETTIEIGLTRDAAHRMADATGRWIKRRMAILYEGMVMTAPVVQARIEGGALAFPIRGDQAEAIRIAHELQRP
jgi:preprotein translocase subunit SecD